MRKIILIIIAIAALALLFIFLRPKKAVDHPASAAPQMRHYDITVQGRRVTSGTIAPSANQGDTVELAVTSDEAGELHLHGYDQSIQLIAGQPVTLSFTANIAGHFEYELEELGIVLGQLTVQPK